MAGTTARIIDSERIDAMLGAARRRRVTSEYTDFSLLPLIDCGVIIAAATIGKLSVSLTPEILK